VNLSLTDFLLLEARQNAKCRTAPAMEHEPTQDRESKLHKDILGWCDSQWPRWKYIHSRTDKKATTQVGTPDFVIFGPQPVVLIIECKKAGGKLSEAQIIFIKEMEMLGWKVEVVFSYEQFLELVTVKHERHD